jgi:predicted nucleotidyltransferase
MIPSVDQRMALAQQAAALLYSRGARRVWLFGSLAKGNLQDKRSDIDLAVEGLPTAVRDGAVAELRGRYRSRIDLLAIETTPPGLRASVVRTRVLLPRTVGTLEAPSPGRDAPPGSPGCDLQPRLYQQRLAAVIQVLKDRGARSVIDLGCGGGWLIEALARTGTFTTIAGADMAEEVIRDTGKRLQAALTLQERRGLHLFATLLTFRDPRLLGYDAAVATEVIEHMDPPRLAAFEHVLFTFVRPPTIVITTPNREYNVKWRIQFQHGLRHERHQFEWTRREFQAWAAAAAHHGYNSQVVAVGPIDPVVGPPTQMAVFAREP